MYRFIYRYQLNILVFRQLLMFWQYYSCAIKKLCNLKDMKANCLFQVFSDRCSFEMKITKNVTELDGTNYVLIVLNGSSVNIFF